MFSQVLKPSILSLLIAVLVLPLSAAAMPTDSDSVKFEYDANGNHIQSTTNAKTTRFEYDAYNRQIGITDASGAKRAMTYDAQGNLTSFTDELGNRSVFTYNSINQLTSTQDALGHLTRASLDAQNNLDVLTDALGGEIRETHDELSRLTSFTNALGKTTHYGYNTDGSLKERINADGSWIRYHRNAMGWVSDVTYSDGTSVSIEYDPFGNMTRISDGDTDFRYVYDAQNRLVEATDVILKTSISYAYDAMGRRTRMVDASGSVVDYQYNARGLPTAIARDGKVEMAYQYDVSGHNVKETLGNGVTVEKTLDTNSRLLRSVHRSPEGELLSRITYQRDPRGFITHETRELHTPRGTLEKSAIVYEYDAMGQLVKETRTDTDTGKLLYSYRYKYDSQNNRTHRISHDGTIVRYTYNAAGQLLREEVSRPTAEANHRVFNAFATFQSFEDSRNTDTESRVVEYSYDDNGNLVSEQLGAQVVSYEYDVEGRLIAVDTPQGRTEYILTPDGKRVGIVKDGRVTRLMHDKFDVNLEVSESETRYLSGLGIDQVLLREKSGRRYYYHRGTANSVFQVSDATGKVVNTYDYDAFGQPVSTIEGVENTAKFGAREETTPGTYYFRERLYSSRTGRFLSIDPIRAADANRSFRVGSLPSNANSESEALVYQQRLTPSGYVYTGQLKSAQLIDDAVASSPLFQQRLITGITGLDVSGYVYVGNNPTNHADPTGEVIYWNPISYYPLSGCYNSSCYPTSCSTSTCQSSACSSQQTCS